MRKWAALVTVRFTLKFPVKNAIYAICKYIRIRTFADSGLLSHRVYPWFLQMIRPPCPCHMLP